MIEPPPPLGRGEVLVLHTSLDVETEHLFSILNEDEQARAGRYHTEVLRRRFIAGRAFLRSVLGFYLDADPRLLRFAYGHEGKPSLDGAHAMHPLRFNLSHTDEVALLALTLEGEIGADVEGIRRDIEHAGLAVRFFSPREVAWLMSVLSADIAVAFSDCWTAKEAYLKARGDGLTFPLDAFHVIPGGDAVLDLEVYGDPRESARWSVRHIIVADDVRAAVAAEGRPRSVRTHPWRLGQALSPVPTRH